VKKLPGEANPTDISIAQEQLLAEEKRRSRVHEDHVVITAGHAKAMVGLLGGTFLAALKIGVLEKSLAHYLARGRMPLTVIKKLRVAAIERFKEVIK
jgi:hypothetical protein